MALAPRALSLFALLALAATSNVGCALSSESDEAEIEDVDADSEAVTASWSCNVSSLGTNRCQSTIADIRAQAAAAGRSYVVERGLSWLADGNTYNRNGVHNGYRRDCSGFVSMCWEFESNPNTALFPPFVTGKYAVPLGSFDDLVPGDAINKTYRNPYGHVMLFAGWASADHQQLYFMHHYSTGKPVALVQVSRSSLGDFMPIRSIELGDAKPAEPPPPAPAGCGVMAAGGALGENQGLTSCDGRFTLVQQGDGNLVLYMAGKGALWSSGTAGTKGRTMVMQDDGNLVVYTPDGKAVWNSGTWGHPGTWLAVQDDGNVVLYQYGAIWSTGTAGH